MKNSRSSAAGTPPSAAVSEREYAEVIEYTVSAMVTDVMSLALSNLDVLVLDCQASGATPAHGDLLELGWAFCGENGLYEPIQGHWITPRTLRPVSRAVRELTGWSEACASESILENEAWNRLLAGVRARCSPRLTRVPTLIHYARFELPFLRDLHQRLGDQGEFPFEILCLHAIAARLFPDLPRRNIRALAGFLGHSTELMRRAGGHVAASAFIWRALIPRLEEQQVTTWDELSAWLAAAPKATRRTGRVYPLAVERRRSLPDKPGVYRFVRSNGSVLYVGKATSLKKRIAGHFSRRGPSTERGLELLSQVHDIITTETASILESALLETDEIKRLDPPYNVQLRQGERHAWFATRELDSAAREPDARHNVGPLPSERALISFAAVCALVGSADITPAVCAMALAVPTSELPDPVLFGSGFQAFHDQHIQAGAGSVRRRVERASRVLFLARGRIEPAVDREDPDRELWDLARVKRRLERALIHGGLLIRRASLLRLLADCELAYHEPGCHPRVIVVIRAQITECSDIERVEQLGERGPRPSLGALERRSCIDAASYDRLRVLTTELNRVLQDGGDVTLRIGKHLFGAERVRRLFASI